MNCEQAKKLIDQRVQLSAAEAAGDSATSSPGATDQPDWSDLDAHLAKCRKCSAEFLELLRTRKLLAGLSDDAPTPQETESMWTAIQSAAACPAPSKVGDTITSAWSKRRWILHFTAATVGLAAVLMLAFVVGQFRYDQQDSYLADLLAPLQLGEAPKPLAEMKPPPVPARPERRPSSKRDSRESLRAGFHDVNGDDMALDTDALENLESLGYAGAKRYTASPPPVATEQLWARARRREAIPRQYISPSSSSAPLARYPEDGGVAVAPDSQESFNALGRVSYGYGVPQGPDKAPAAESSTSVGAKFILRAPPEAPPLPGSKREELRTYRRDQVGTAFVLSALPDPADNSGAFTVDKNRAAEQSPASQDVRAYRLERADAQQVADALNEAFAGGRGGGRGGGGGIPVSISGDPGSNSVLVRANDKDVEQIAKVIEELDDADAVQDHATQGADASPHVQKPGPPEQAARAQPKIIKTGELAFEVAKYDEALQQAEAIVGQFGAFIADVQAQEQAGGAMLGRLTIRVVPEHFEALFAALKTVGRVEAENVKAADVTAQYVDLEARIRSLQITEQRLQELIKSKSFIDKIADLLEIERELTRVRSQIEQFQASFG